MKDDRVIIPLSASRLSVLDKIHTQVTEGIQKCRKRAKSVVWWPNLSNQIEDLVRECPTCYSEPMFPSHVTRASIPKSSNRSIRIERTRIRPRGRLLPVIIGNWSTSKIHLSRSDQSLKSDFRQPWISSTVFLSRIRQIWIHTHYKQSKIPPKQRRSRTYSASN